eukprot:GFUD01100416.1.p1 GENE.GFUD01100416.1~~GFUD01100416.1.p1  ORF type:complete len:233 (-),score=59.01 GFUD01100416.1:6-704(-)
MMDTHLSVAIICDVPAGEDYKSYFPKFYSKVKAGTKDCLYYGFATCGNNVLCREGYKNGAALLAHFTDVRDDLEAMIKKIGKERVMILCSGPASELEKVKNHIDGYLPIKFAELDSGALILNAFPKESEDTHVTIIHKFSVPAVNSKMEKFKFLFPKFYAATKSGHGAAGALYYGFVVSDDSIYCRGGYKVVGAVDYSINVVGPATELEKLVPILAPREAIFWELDTGAFWM